MLSIEGPLTFVRDYTCPMGEEAAWDRTRASVVPATMTISLFWLYGLLQDDPDRELLDIGLYAMIPGAIIGVLIRLKTKASGPPTWLMNIYAFLCFLMSLLWIKFSSDCIVDLL